MSAGKITLLVLILIMTLGLALAFLEQGDANQRKPEISRVLEPPVPVDIDEEQFTPSSMQVLTSNLTELEQSEALFYFEGEPYPFVLAGHRFVLSNVQASFEEHYPQLSRRQCREFICHVNNSAVLCRSYKV